MQNEIENGKSIAWKQSVDMTRRWFVSKFQLFELVLSGYLLCQLDTNVTEIIDLVIHLLRSSLQTLLHHCKYTVDSGNLMEMMTVKAYIVELFIEIQMPSV